MKKLIILFVLLMAASTMAQTTGGYQYPVDVLGGDFGVLMSKDGPPEFGYALTAQFSIKPISGLLFDRAEVSALYADRPWDKAAEIYAVRGFSIKEIHYKKAFVGFGPGTWMFANSNGGDYLQTAFRADVGMRTGHIHAHIGGDIVSREGADLYFVFAGLVIAI